jgi:F420-non-reducing hydrogenase iron-sulfur subunit
MANENNKVVTLMCERSAEIMLDADGKINSVDGLYAVKLPCSGMVQPNMIERAMKAGAAGVIVCGCQIGDCYYREGNKMIRERLLGTRQPGLKKTVDRRRVLALWLSRVQKERFLAEAGEFVKYVRALPAAEPAAAPAAKPAAAAPAKPAAAAPAATAAPAAKDASPEEKAAAVPAPEEKKVVEVVDGKIDTTKVVTPAPDDSNAKDPKIEVDVPPIKEGQGPL